MLRFLNVLALFSLLGSAGYAYSIKYETVYRSEQIVKINNKIKLEREAVTVLRAEWAYLTRPERLQALADKYLDLEAAKPAQIIDLAGLPERGARVDSIGRKLEALGLAEPTNTPAASSNPAPVTPQAKGR